MTATLIGPNKFCTRCWKPKRECLCDYTQVAQVAQEKESEHDFTDVLYTSYGRQIYTLFDISV